MTWPAPALTRITKFADLKTALATSLADLFQQARLYEPIAVLPYGTTVRPSGDTTQVQLVAIADQEAFTIANPSNPREGVELTLDLWNVAEQDIGAVTWGDQFSLDGAFVAPEDNQHALYTFVWSL